MRRNTGVSFEREIHQSASSLGSVVLVKVPVGYSSGLRFAGGGCVDFLGVICGVPFAIEAKSCRGNRFALSRITEKQVQFMERWEAAGGRAVVLLKFSGSDVRVVAIPFRLLMRWRLSGKKGVSRRDLDGLFTITGRTGRWRLDQLSKLKEEQDD